MKRLFIILFVFAFGFNTNAQEDYMASNEDSGYVEISDNSDSEKPSKIAFKPFFQKADEETVKIFPNGGIQKKVVYKNMLYWVVTDFSDFKGYIFESNKDFSKIKYIPISEKLSKMSIEEIAVYRSNL